MSNDILIAASSFSNVSGIPLSKIIAFVENQSEKQERQSEKSERKLEIYATNRMKAVQRQYGLASEYLIDSFGTTVSLPIKIADAYREAMSE